MKKTFSKEFVRIIEKIEDPADFYEGMRSSMDSVPNNILYFKDISIEELQGFKENCDFHHRHILVFAIESSVKISINSASVKLDEGELFYISPFELHYYQEAKKGLWFFFTFDMKSHPLLDALKEGRIFKIDQKCAELLEKYFTYQKLTDERTPLCQFVLLELLYFLVQQTRGKKDRLRSRGMNLQFKNYIEISQERKMPESSSGKNIADQRGVTASGFYQQFKKEYGYGYGKFSFERRIYKATQHLIYSQEPISVIARKSGWQSVAAFCRSFKKFWKKTPLQFRRENASGAKSCSGPAL